MDPEHRTVRRFSRPGKSVVVAGVIMVAGIAAFVLRPSPRKPEAERWFMPGPLGKESGDGKTEMWKAGKLESEVRSETGGRTEMWKAGKLESEVRSETGGRTEMWKAGKLNQEKVEGLKAERLTDGKAESGKTEKLIEEKAEKLKAEGLTDEKAESGKQKAERLSGEKAEKLKSETNLSVSECQNFSVSASQHFSVSKEVSVSGYLTRAFSGLRLPEEQAWATCNGLTDAVPFSHNLNRVFPPDLYASHPEYFPLADGKRLQPPNGSYFWNPDLGRADVAQHAATTARRHFDEHPDAEVFSLGTNDGLVFGESAETLALVQPARWFRGRPDYSGLVFTFMNRAAGELSRTHPTKYLGCLAYYWAENIPPFGVDPHVLPFLTADRSQSYDAAFRREELDLQSRWARTEGKAEGLKAERLNEEKAAPPSPDLSGYGAARSGKDEGRLKTEKLKSEPTELRAVSPDGAARRADIHEIREISGLKSEANPSVSNAADGERTEIWKAGKLESEANLSVSASSTVHRPPSTGVSPPPRRIGLYDYLDGHGFLVPRVPIRAFAGHIQHARRVGFTDYYGESSRNWGIDGPMPWAIAQLLQDPGQDVERLLDEYYGRYFKRAAKPMRAFFDRCEQQWMQQSGPAYWLKHYRNESQASLFPVAVRAELRALLDDAAAQADSPLVRQRVGFVADAFGVTERFASLQESRTRLSTGVLRDELRGEAGMARLLDYLDRRAEFLRYTKRLTERSPLSFYPINYDDFLRNDPAFSAAMMLAEVASLPESVTGRSNADLLDARHAMRAIHAGRTRERLVDRSFEGEPKPGRRIAGLSYGVDLPKPWQSIVEPAEHHIGVLATKSARTGVKGLRIGGTENSIVYQWHPVTKNHVYIASVFTRGQVSPSTIVLVALAWLDRDRKHIGNPVAMRLPDGKWPEWVQLRQGQRAPANAAWVGIAVRVQHQTGDDWAEFDDPSLVECLE